MGEWGEWRMWGEVYAVLRVMLGWLIQVGVMLMLVWRSLVFGMMRRVESRLGFRRRIRGVVSITMNTSGSSG